MRNYKQLNQTQRYQIDILKKAGKNQKKILELLGLSESTISRELKRVQIGSEWAFRLSQNMDELILAVLIPFSLIESDQRFDVVPMTTETLLAFIFVTIERLGAELRDPFENRINDTPMTALCRSIGIDLRQQLGETGLPPPVEPINGVLM